MLQYVNQFNCAVNDRHNECVINFSQERPDMDETGKITGVESSVISSVVMTMDNARALLSVMHQLLNAPETTTAD